MSSTSDNNSVTSSMFVDEYKYPDWFTHKTYLFYKKKLDHLSRLRYIHSESAAYYDSQHFKLYAPSIVITGLSGVASFLSSSSLFNNETQTGLAIGVGVLASISAMIQSAASAVDYSTKAKLHREAGEDYEKLITKVEFEMEMPNEPEFIDNLETIILDIQNKCKYAAPRHIIDGYDNYLSRKNKKILKNLYNKKNKYNQNKSHSIINIPPTNVNEQSPLLINEINNVNKDIKSHIIDFTDINDIEDNNDINEVNQQYIYDEENDNNTSNNEENVSNA
jgi:hypothetical protein